MRNGKKAFVDGDKTDLQEINPDDTRNAKEPSKAAKEIIQQLEADNVEYREVHKHSKFCLYW